MLRPKNRVRDLSTKGKKKGKTEKKTEDVRDDGVSPMGGWSDGGKGKKGDFRG